MAEKQTPIPDDVLSDFRESARLLLGSGYVDDYYDSAASEFYWAYRAGYAHGKTDVAAKAKKRKKARVKRLVEPTKLTARQRAVLQQMRDTNEELVWDSSAACGYAGSMRVGRAVFDGLTYRMALRTVAVDHGVEYYTISEEGRRLLNV